jgi:hypothetical protein
LPRALKVLPVLIVAAFAAAAPTRLAVGRNQIESQTVVSAWAQRTYARIDGAGRDFGRVAAQQGVFTVISAPALSPATVDRARERARLLVQIADANRTRIDNEIAAAREELSVLPIPRGDRDLLLEAFDEATAESGARRLAAVQLAVVQRVEALLTLMQERRRHWTTQGNVVVITDAATLGQFRALSEDTRDLAAVMSTLEADLIDPAAETFRVLGVTRSRDPNLLPYLLGLADALMIAGGGILLVAFMMAIVSLPVMKLSARSIGFGSHLLAVQMAFTSGLALLMGAAVAFALWPTGPNDSVSTLPAVAGLIGYVLIGWLISDDLSRRGVTRAFPIGARVILWILALSLIVALSVLILDPSARSGAEETFRSGFERAF